MTDPNDGFDGSPDTEGSPEPELQEQAAGKSQDREDELVSTVQFSKNGTSPCGPSILKILIALRQCMNSIEDKSTK
jgi:hypothetical protein